jgi:perosamine synthetase
MDPGGEHVHLSRFLDRGYPTDAANIPQVSRGCRFLTQITPAVRGHEEGVGKMLAVDGGTPVRTTPFPKRALFGAQERDAAVALFDQAMQTGDAIGYNGPEETAYEQEFSEWHGGGMTDLVNSGTSALYVALGGLELAPAGEVVVPPITDPGGVMPVALHNLVPVPADASPGTFNAGALQIAAVLTPHTRAILVAHIAGEPADMGPILDLAKEKNLPVVEDCAQAHGARYHGRLVGTMGDVAAYSTMSGKHHATGPQGGVVFTTHEDLGWRCRRFSDRGKPFGLQGRANVRAGLNLNGSDLAATVGRVQLRKLDSIIAGRRRVAAQIASGLAPCEGLQLGHEHEGAESVYWFLRIHFDDPRFSCDKNEFAAALAAEGIPVSASYRHLPAEAEWFRERKVFPPSDYPWGLPAYGGDREATFECANAVAAVESHFTLPIHEQWTKDDGDDVISALIKVAGAFRI